jgi:hypothetical protein
MAANQGLLGSADRPARGGMCTFFATPRGCRNGTACQFVHMDTQGLIHYRELDPTASQRPRAPALCKFFASSVGCKNGTTCTYLHDMAASMAAAARTGDSAPEAHGRVGKLPDGWVIGKDNSTGKTYYYHMASRTSQWEYPRPPTTTNYTPRASSSYSYGSTNTSTSSGQLMGGQMAAVSQGSTGSREAARSQQSYGTTRYAHSVALLHHHHHHHTMAVSAQGVSKDGSPARTE